MVKPMNIIRPFQLKLHQGIKTMIVYELRFDDFKGRFGYGIVIRAALHAQRTANMKAVQQLVDEGVVEFVPPVCVEYLDVKEVSPHRGKGLTH